jgi:hypothetical protein
MQLRFHIPEPYSQDFTIQVNVTTQGIFTATLPHEVSRLFEGKIELAHYRRDSAPGYFSDDTLEGLKTQIGGKLAALCSENLVSTERIIRFAIETACAYAKDNDGVIHANAQGPGRDWCNGISARNATARGPYGLQIYVCVLDKLRYRYTSTGATRIAYQEIERCDDENDPAEWLCRLTGLSAHNGYNANHLTLQEMPYTEEAAHFFVGLFKWLFNVNERITPFLNPEGIKILAESGAKRLLA